MRTYLLSPPYGDRSKCYGVVANTMEEAYNIFKEFAERNQEQNIIPVIHYPLYTIKELHMIRSIEGEKKETKMVKPKFNPAIMTGNMVADENVRQFLEKILQDAVDLDIPCAISSFWTDDGSGMNSEEMQIETANNLDHFLKLLSEYQKADEKFMYSEPEDADGCMVLFIPIAFVLNKRVPIIEKHGLAIS